jgi:hypothetical protein
MEKRNRRPRLVTIAALAVFLLGVDSFLQAGLAILQFNSLNSLPLSVPAWYFLSGGVLWGVAWMISATGIWRQQAWAFVLTLILLPVHLAAFLADRLFLTRAPAIQNAFGFHLAIQIVCTVLGILFVLLARRRHPASGQPTTNHEG